MKQTDKIEAVGKMQKYILTHLNEKITLDDLSRTSGYSKFHAVRMFKELSGDTPYEYIRALRLTKAAESLRDFGGKIIEIALKSGFESHDGFTRAFERRFGITPKRYAEEKPAVPYFIHRSVSAYYLFNEKDITMENERVPRTVTVTAVERPERKLILLRAKNTKDGCYEGYCEEMGCEWEGLLNSIPEKFAPAGLLTLPDSLVTPGTSNTASGVEVPVDYSKSIPEGYDVIVLNPCTMLFFQGSRMKMKMISVLLSKLHGKLLIIMIQPDMDMILLMSLLRYLTLARVEKWVHCKPYL